VSANRPDHQAKHDDQHEQHQGNNSRPRGGLQGITEHGRLPVYA
jgi:hypothetical protein